MISRRVTEAGRDSDGTIAALGGPWGTASKAEAIRDISNGWYRYYVQDHQGRQASVEVVHANRVHTATSLGHQA